MSNRIESSDKHSSTARSDTFLPWISGFGTLAGVSIIIFAVLIVYLPSINGGFIWDDDLLLTNNSLIRAPDGLYWFWFTKKPTDYWPMTNTTFWIEWRLWEMNSTGYHVTNLILHIVETLLIWLILRKLSIPGAFLAAMIFAVHPVNVESVAWIASRKNLMAMLFFLLTILFYLKLEVPTPSLQNGLNRLPSPPGAMSVVARHSPFWYWLSLAAFLLAMLSKGSVVILPVLLLGIVWWSRTAGTTPIFAHRTVPIFAGDCPDFCAAKMRLSPSLSIDRWDLLRIVPFFVVAAVLAGVNLWFQTHGTGEVIRSATFAQRLLGAGGVVWFYLYKALLPINLAFVYPQWNIQPANPLWWLPIAAAFVLTAMLWWHREGWSRPSFLAWGFFCVALLPVLGFMDVFFMRYSLVADHYQHIALIGLIALLSAGWTAWHQQARGVTLRAATVVAVMSVGILAFLTWRQTTLYRDEMTLYQDTLKKNPDCWMAHNNLGKLLLDTGQVQESIEHFQQALRIKYDYPEAHYNLGNALYQTGRPLEAIDHFREALRIKPNYIDALNNLGVTMTEIGRPQEAIKIYEQALRLNPDFPDAHLNMANALVKTSRFQEAIDQCNQALALRPDYIEAQISLGAALALSGRPQEAIEHYEQALLINPNYPEAHNNLANALLDIGRVREAIEHSKRALVLKPDYPEAYHNLGAALTKTGRPELAINYYEQALRLKPNYPDAHSDLGNVLVKTGRTEEAIEHYRQALLLKSDSPEVHNNLAGLLFHAGRYQEAIEHYEQAIRLKPDYGNAHYNLGNTFNSVGQHQQAIEHFKKAIELRPDNISACKNLAMTYAITNQSSDAIAAAQKALELARSQGQTAQAKEIEEWLNSYQGQGARGQGPGKEE